MDVSAIASGTGGTTGTPSAAVPASATAGTPAQQGTPTPPQPDAQQGEQHDHGLAPAIAKLFGSSSSPQPLTLNVSYRVVKDLNEIVTVFSDPKTGKEIAQFPPELLIGLAQFFDHERGATLDKSA